MYPLDAPTRSESMLSEVDDAIALLKAAPMAALLVNPAGVVQYASGALRACIGVDARAVEGRRIDSLLDPSHPTSRSDFSHALARPQATAMPVRLRGEGNGQYPLTLLAFVQECDEPFDRHQSRAVFLRPGACGVGAGEGTSCERADSLVSQELGVAFRRLAHELRTPLNAVLGLSELLLMELSAPGTEWARGIFDAGRYLNELVDGLTQYAQAHVTADGSHAAPLTLEAVHIVEVLRAAIRIAKTGAANREVDMQVHVEPDASVFADRTKVEQVLLNLLTNALKYTRKGGRVAVDVSRATQETVCIEVRDTGVGMTDAQLAALFDPFARVGPEAAQVPGSGLGLWISRQLATLMKGSLSASSTPGTGTIVRFVLPAAA